jgi:dTDP-4-dehydrorhamnose 3,5-epimerase-like enzyme
MQKKVYYLNLKHIPKKKLYVHENKTFGIKRIYFHKNLKRGYEFGKHAHRITSQIFICLCGSLKISIMLKNKKKTYLLNNSSKALYIEAGVFKKIKTMSNNTIMLTLANKRFFKEDYIFINK